MNVNASSNEILLLLLLDRDANDASVCATPAQQEWAQRNTRATVIIIASRADIVTSVAQSIKHTRQLSHGGAQEVVLAQRASAFKSAVVIRMRAMETHRSHGAWQLVQRKGVTPIKSVKQTSSHISTASDKRNSCIVTPSSSLRPKALEATSARAI
jgi:hypothetical protein